MSTETLAVNRLDRGAWARRHNHALVALARQVWHDDCTLDTALALICETAAETLDVERVNIWKLDAANCTLLCVHAYQRDTGVHNAPGYDEVLDCDSAYGAQLNEVRVIDVDDVTHDDTLFASQAALGAYLRRHRIRS